MHQLNRQYIPSGDFYVSGRSPVVLKAVLGTCVGVAIIDRENQVGGLIHLLLSESTAANMSANPARYAASGLPLFINALIKNGARKEHMVAAIAGGALVGPVNRQDLALNIGGQTAEVANRIILEHDITIGQSETGGGFSCCLCLDMSKWETYIEPVMQPQDEASEKHRAPDRKAIDASIENLTPIPQVALKILNLIDKDDCNLSRISREVALDQVLSAKTLKLCNSAMYGLSRPISSVDNALIFLGKNLFSELIIAAAVNGYFDKSDQGYSICKGGLYHHAVGTAIISEKLARFTGKIKSTTAYIAGLLHDIGKVVLDQYICEAFPLMYRDVTQRDLDIRDIENNIIGIDHTQVGEMLAKRWKMPDFLCDTIANHHEPADASVNPELTSLVCIADFLMSRFHSGLELESISDRVFYESMERVDIPASQLLALIDLIPNRVFTVPYAA
jgi:putative nucleotidyltransferase with HDIG domain